jgi:Na+-translocating ferredoxin:NAD+ oxidoreductase RNF subunit RnfB
MSFADTPKNLYWGLSSMDSIIVAVLYVTVIGIICAVILSVASKILHVDADERVAQLLECLPGSNCGACGFAGCSGYAAVLASNPDAQTNLCTPGGEDVVKKLSALLGVEEGRLVTKHAVIHCRGDNSVRQKKTDYQGIYTCAAARRLFGGESSCAYGCLGYGDCQKVCPSGAICVENGLARINPALCSGCGICAKACPNKLISVYADTVGAVVFCGNREKGAAARKKCGNCCLGCGKCVRKCPSKAIEIRDNLAVIEYEKCDGCGKCVKECAARCILWVFDNNKQKT